MNENHLFNKIVALAFLVYLIIISIVWNVSRDCVPKPPVVESPKIIAHRGANDRFNESTLTAYKIAADDGVDALEIDLRMTEDSSLIAMHDETIDRTTDATGEVSNYTLQEIKSFRTVGVFGNEKTTEDVPTLKEIVKTFTDRERYYIETRLVNGQLAMEEPLIQLLNDYDLIEKDLVTIQSFSQKSLEKINKLAPEIPLTLLFSKGNFNLKEAKSVVYPIIGIESTDVTMKNVNELHVEGKEVHVFFNDNDTQEKEQERVKAFLVDGYFTDDITFTKELLNEN